MLPCCLFMTEKSIAEESKKCSNETAKYTHNTFFNKDEKTILELEQGKFKRI